MKEEKSSADRVIEAVTRILVEQFSRFLREKAKQCVREVAKRIAVIVIGILLMVSGLFYVMLGITKAIALYLPEWGAFGLVGILVIVIGYLALRMVTK